MWPRSQTKNKNGTAQGLSGACRPPGPRNLPKRTVRTFQGLPGTSHQASLPVQATPFIRSSKTLAQEPFRRASSQSPFGRPTRAQGLFGLAMMLRQPCLPRPYLAFESWARYALALLEPLLVHVTSYVECLTGNKSSYKLHHPSIQQVSWRVERPRDHGRLC